MSGCPRSGVSKRRRMRSCWTWLRPTTTAVQFYEQQGFNRVLSAYYRPADTLGAELRPAPGTVRRAGAADQAAVLRYVERRAALPP